MPSSSNQLASCGRDYSQHPDIWRRFTKGLTYLTENDSKAQLSEPRREINAGVIEHVRLEKGGDSNDDTKSEQETRVISRHFVYVVSVAI